MAEAALGQLRLHEEAFRQLGGLSREILYDKKIIALGRDKRDEVEWQRSFWISRL